MNNTEMFNTLKLHSFVIWITSFIFYLIFLYIFNLFVSEEEKENLLLGKEKELRPLILCLVLNATLFRIVSIATGTTFIALVLKDVL